MKILLFISLAVAATPCLAENIKFEFGSESVAKEFFGINDSSVSVLEIDLGGYSLKVEPRVQCGKIDLDTNVKVWYDDLRKTTENFVNYWKDGNTIIHTAGMLALAEGLPKVYSYLTKNRLLVENKIKSRLDLCQHIDKYLEGRAGEGARLLRTEAQNKCIKRESEKTGSYAKAVELCSHKTGLPLRDFENWMKGATKQGAQRVLKGITSFVHKSNKNGSISDTLYNRITSLLGDIEVQDDSGVWKPLFEKSLLTPEGLVKVQSKSIEDKGCTFESYLNPNTKVPEDPFEAGIYQVVRSKVRPIHIKYMKLLNGNEKKMVCFMLSKSIGREAAKNVSEDVLSQMATGQKHPAIPSKLTEVFYTRANRFTKNLTSYLERGNVPTVSESLELVVKYGKLKAYQSEQVARELSGGSINNKIQENSVKKCVDALTCFR